MEVIKAFICLFSYSLIVSRVNFLWNHEFSTCRLQKCNAELYCRTKHSRLSYSKTHKNISLDIIRLYSMY